MNEFELRLESELARLLNPIVAAPPPVRRKRSDLRRIDDAQSPGQPMPHVKLLTASVESLF